jgi:hypothetical protein
MHCQADHLLRNKFVLWRDVLRHGSDTSYCCVLADTLVSLYSAACEDKEKFEKFLKHGLKIVLGFDQVSPFISCVFTG